MNKRYIYSDRLKAEAALSETNKAQLYWKNAQVWEVSKINLPGMCLNGASSFKWHKPLELYVQPQEESSNG